MRSTTTVTAGATSGAHADIFASITNYLAKVGWNNRHTWGRQVQLPDKLEAVAAGLECAAARMACARDQARERP